jgi:hypothetical protein
MFLRWRLMRLAGAARIPADDFEEIAKFQVQIPFPQPNRQMGGGTAEAGWGRGL